MSAERDRINSRIGDLVSARARLGTVMAAATANRRTGEQAKTAGPTTTLLGVSHKSPTLSGP
ncbi:hypothetical protein [Streptomyces niveus]